MTVAIHIPGVRPDVRAAVERDAQDRNLSVNAVVVAILAKRYGVAWDTPGRPYIAGEGGEDWLVRMPDALREAIRAHARSLVGGSQRGIILLALAEHYGLPPESPRRRREAVIPEDVVNAARLRNREGESLRALAREYGVHRETLTRAVRA